MITTKIKLRLKIINLVELLYLKKIITGNKNIVIDNKFNEGDQVNAESLFDLNLIRNKRLNVKILGNGNLNKSLKISVHSVTKSAESKIKKSGSTIELINEQSTENKD